MPGPPKKPTKLLQLSGSQLAAKRTGEPQPSKKMPKQPEDLTPEEAKEWKHLCWQLTHMQVGAVVDGDAMRRICSYRVMFDEARAEIRRTGYEDEYKDKLGNVCRRNSPAVARMLKASGELLKLEARFGLTPSDRANIGAALHAGQQGKESEEDRIFNRGKKA